MIWRLAWRNLWRQRSRTLILMSAVTLSYAMVLAAMGMGGDSAVACRLQPCQQDIGQVQDACLDAVDAYVVLASRAVPGEAYNVGSGESRTIRSVLDELVEISGVEVEVAIDPERFRPQDVPLLSADTRKLRALGWRPGRSVGKALGALWSLQQEEHEG